MEEQFSARRWKSACTLMTSQNGEQVIVVAGGIHVNSKGMEMWNPNDHTVTLLATLLPNESEKSLGLNHAQLVPIKGGSEMLMYGGWQGDYQDGIWKFNLAEGSWDLHGKLLRAREEHAVLPISGIMC